MKHSAAYILLILISIISAMPVSANAIEVQALVDKQQITLEDTIFLRVEVKGSKAQVDLSGVTDFKVMPRGSSSLTQITNGRMEKKITYQYILSPLRKGTLTIPPIKAEHKGVQAFTQPITITVSTAQIDPEEQKELFVRASATPSQLVVGQQSVFSLEFLTSRNLTTVGFESLPGFSGISAKPFENETSYTRTLNGIPYQVTRVDYLIVPQASGDITIAPAVLVANVIIKSDAAPRFDSFFNDSFFNTRQTKPVRVIANPVTLSVAPLPPYTGDGVFSGLIGTFDIKAVADNTTLTVGDSMTLSIRISGTGNVMDAGAPVLLLPEKDFKVYDDNPAESIRLTSEGYTGYKEFKRAVVPVAPGRYTLGAVQLTYFDVALNQYNTLSTQPIAIEVAPSQKILVTEASPQSPAASVLPEKKTVALLNPDILELKEGLDLLENYTQLSYGPFFAALAGPGVLFLLVRLFAGVRGRKTDHGKVMAQKAVHHLKKARRSGPDEDSFWGDLYAAVVAAVIAKTGEKKESLALHEARQVLDRSGTPEALVQEAVELLETIESVRFGGRPKSDAPSQNMLERVQKLLKGLGLSVLLAVLTAAAPADAMAGSAEVYLNGVNAYRQGHYQEAARTFEQVAQTPIRNPGLFYNIGNAHLKAGDIGRAILWYERARLMAPNDPDLRFNLANAVSRVKDRQETGANLLDVIFFWDNLISLKVLQIVCICLSVVFFTWAGIRAWTGKKTLSGTGMAILALFLMVCCITGIGMAKQRNRSYAVIVADQADVRAGTLENAALLFTLHAGTKVRVDEKKDQYLKIVFSKDKIGWVLRDRAEII